MAGFIQNMLDDNSDSALSRLKTRATEPVSTDLPLNQTIQELPEGFGSYLTNILPEDIATAAGAFGSAMRQIRNVEAIPIEKLAQAISNLESLKGLNLVGGTDVPVDLPLANEGIDLIALGSGPNGTYTMSDLFGAMSALPYPLSNIESGINSLQTTTLSNIYKQLYLAVTWERATATIQYTDDGFGTYTTTGVTLTDPGGGYGREGAVAPVVTVNGATVTATIGTDDTDITTFGRVTALNFTPGTTGSVPTISIDYPPGGSSFSNSIVQGYIDAANTEIARIKNANSVLAQSLNDWYNQTGTALTFEQKSRELTYPPVPVPQSTLLSQFPMTAVSFIDAVPSLATNTKPHMYAQTLEAISDLTTVGGQSIVGMMRQSRNEARLRAAGITLDNNIPIELPPTENKELIANGTLANTLPSYMNPPPVPLGSYDPVANVYLVFPDTPLDTGNPEEPGSLAASPYQELIPAELNTAYTSDLLPSAVFTVSEAIDDVVKCNCDCWIN